MRANERLAKALRPARAKRKVLTGANAAQTWDVIRVAGGAELHLTQYPHLTFGINARECDAKVTVPHRVSAEIRLEVMTDSYEKFQARVAVVTQAL